MTPDKRGPLAALTYATNSEHRTEESLSDAVKVHAAGLDRGRLLRLLHSLLWLYGDSCRAVDKLTGALERTAGTGSAQRISRKLDGDNPGPVTDGA
jgi:hypothetical protein